MVSVFVKKKPPPPPIQVPFNIQVLLFKKAGKCGCNFIEGNVYKHRSSGYIVDQQFGNNGEQKPGEKNGIQEEIQEES